MLSVTLIRTLSQGTLLNAAVTRELFSSCGLVVYANYIFFLGFHVYFFLGLLQLNYVSSVSVIPIVFVVVMTGSN